MWMGMGPYVGGVQVAAGSRHQWSQPFLDPLKTTVCICVADKTGLFD